jgi:hypothetical protein
VKDKTTPLKLMLENGMHKLQQAGCLIISGRKRDVIIDAAATGPAMQEGRLMTRRRIMQACFCQIPR